MSKNKKKKPVKYFLPVTLPMIHLQKDPNMPYITEYKGGGKFLQALGDVGKVGLNILDETQQAVTGADFYDPKMATDLGVDFQKGVNTYGDVAQVAAPVVANMFVPGLGTAMQATQTIGKSIQGEDPTNERHQLNDNAQNAIMTGVGTAAQLAPLAGSFMTPNVDPSMGSASALPFTQKYGGEVLKYDNGGPYYTYDPKDPKLKAYQDSLKINDYLSKYNKTLDSLNTINDAKMRDDLMNKKWYGTKDATALDTLLSATGLNLINEGRSIPGSNIEYNYQKAPNIPKAVLLKEGETIPQITAPDIKSTTAVDPNWKYSKTFVPPTTTDYNPTLNPDIANMGLGIVDPNRSKIVDDKMKLPPVTFNNGGNLNMTEYNGLPHELGGIPIGQESEVENGETRVGDYIFSDSLKPEGSDKTFAELSKKINKKYSIRQNDAPSQKAMKKELEGLMMANEQARIAQEQMEGQMMEEAFMKYGGCIKYQNGGLFIDPTKRNSFAKDAKKYNMGVSDFATKIMSYGGKKQYYHGGTHDGGDPMANMYSNLNKTLATTDFDATANPLSPLQLAQIQLAQNPGLLYMNQEQQAELDNYRAKPKQFYNPNSGGDPLNVAGILPAAGSPDQLAMSKDATPYDPSFGIPNYLIADDGRIVEDMPLAQMKQYYAANNLKQPAVQNPNIKNYKSNTEDPSNPSTADKKKNFYDPEAKFGTKEAGYLASNLGPMYNMLKGLRPETTEFERAVAEEVDLTQQRNLAEKQANMAKTNQRGNIRNLASTSGQALSNLAASNSAITSNLQDVLAQSYMNEENTNAQIRNQVNAMNTQIAMQEKIANEQNKAMADSLTGMGLTDVGMNTQGYFRDKGMQTENTRYNNMLWNMTKDGQYFRWVKDENGNPKMEFISLPPQYTPGINPNANNG